MRAHGRPFYNFEGLDSFKAEFAPEKWEAVDARAISFGAALRPVRALLAADPSLRIAAALGTALALLNITDRAPDVPEVAIAKRQRIPRPLRGPEARVVRLDWSLPTLLVQNVPVHRPETVLVHLADRPTQVRSWAAILDALPRLVAECDATEIADELRGRPLATCVRLAYLTQGVAPSLAKTLRITPGGRVWFGPRGKLRHHNAAWNIADTIMPIAPGELAPLPSATADATTPAPDATNPQP